jgi:putative flippase GtrA
MKSLQSFIKFSGSSVVCFLLDNGLFTVLNLFVLSGLADAPRYFAATYGARLVSAVTNFLLNRTVVFHAHNSMKRSALRYLLLSVVQATASAGLVYLFTSLTHLGGIVDTAVKISVDACLFIVSYQIQRRWVFQVDNRSEEE